MAYSHTMPYWLGALRTQVSGLRLGLGVGLGLGLGMEVGFGRRLR